MISNLTISKFELREEKENDKVVIPCVHHKTASRGMAQLVVTIDVEAVLLFYHEKIRIKIVPQDEHKDKFFLTFKCAGSCKRGYQLGTSIHLRQANTVR